ncbi:MAG: ferritin [Thermoplasmatales archaeon]|nr:ferritin [Thermoplasmatales archaeon]
MGTKGKEIVKDLKKIVNELKKALADEWLAYYQYWAGAKVVEGAMREIISAELEEHAKDELKHAEMITGRLLQLGEKPILSPKEWYSLTNCGYEIPSPNGEKIIKQNIKGEQCAIDVYNKLLKITEGRDVITYQMILEILKDEVEHEDDLEILLQDMKSMK